MDSHIFFSHQTALYLWRALAASGGSPGRQMRRLRDPAAPPSSGTGDREGTRELAEEFYASRTPRPARDESRAGRPSTRLAPLGLPDPPLHVLVPRAAARSQSRLLASHVWGGGLPSRPFVRLDEVVRLSTPPFVFLQLARSWELPRLVRLGYEPCGTYSLYGGDARGFCDRPPLVTAARLAAYVEEARRRHMPGAEKALHAVRLVREGAESPMEATLVLLLCLPRSLGGHGLPFPELNHRIDLPAEMARRLGRRFLRCDLYWDDARLDVEYDSDFAHAGSAAIASDAMRLDVLRELGVTVVRVTRRQILDARETDAVARSLGRILGVRSRSRAARGEDAVSRASLRESLLGTRAWRLPDECP